MSRSLSPPPNTPADLRCQVEAYEHWKEDWETKSDSPAKEAALETINRKLSVLKTKLILMDKL